MDLEPSSLRQIMIALKSARSIQSIHLSGPKLKITKSIAQEVFGHLVFDRITMKRIPNDVDDAWND